MNTLTPDSGSGDAAARMNPEVKARWVAALRSGKYKQGQKVLRSAKDKFCCLGVLCDIKNPAQWDSGLCGYEFAGHVHFVPSEIREWAGLPQSLGGAEVTINGTIDSLADHNDAGRTFAEIADAIEQQL
jgi:hypothetical protein